MKYAVVSLYSDVKQQLKCNTSKVYNCLIQFFLTMFRSIEERVFLVEYVFRESSAVPINPDKRSSTVHIYRHDHEYLILL
jgi:hypothetical protein